ncbi:fluoride efflux transporter CrcB [Pelomicrobium sp. G1]|uniref:fluoride efflux transporter CrcB n=1 Tax=unclassified Pelomicrobium TaxID=2815318 RepID=UPI00347DFC26
MGTSGFAAISLGATLGAMLRWWLGHRLNPVFPTLPLGTLAANLLAGFLIGVAVAFFNKHPGLPPETRLMTMTGFLGGLSTFSTFSAEIVSLIARGEYLWALGAIGLHLFGALLLTGLGILSVQLISSA